MPKRVLQGVVVSDKPNKSIVVRVERRVMHPIYKKYIRQSKRYLAHDEDNRFATGDTVRIIECRPLSARKRWTVLLDEAASAKAGGSPAGSGSAADVAAAAATPIAAAPDVTASE